MRKNEYVIFQYFQNKQIQICSALDISGFDLVNVDLTKTYYSPPIEEEGMDGAAYCFKGKVIDVADTKQGAINIFKKLQEDNPEWESFDKDTTDIIPSRSHALVPDFDDPYDTQVCYITDRLKQKEWLIQRPESSEQVEAAGEVQEMVTSGVVTDSESSTMEWNIGDNPEKELLDISYHHKSPCMCEVGDSQYDCGEVTVQPSVFSISDIPSTQDIIAEFDTNQQIKQFGFALRKKRREDLE